MPKLVSPIYAPKPNNFTAPIPPTQNYGALCEEERVALKRLYELYTVDSSAQNLNTQSKQIRKSTTWRRVSLQLQNNNPKFVTRISDSTQAMKNFSRNSSQHIPDVQSQKTSGNMFNEYSTSASAGQVDANSTYANAQPTTSTIYTSFYGAYQGTAVGTIVSDQKKKVIPYTSSFHKNSL